MSRLQQRRPTAMGILRVESLLLAAEAGQPRSLETLSPQIYDLVRTLATM